MCNERAKWWLWGIFIAMGVVLSGCTLPAHKVTPGMPVTALSDDEAVIVGKIEVIVDDKRKSLPMSGWWIRLSHAERQKKVFPIYTEADGNFAYAIPRGTYLIKRASSGSCWEVVPDRATFSTGTDADIVYLGTLRIEIKSSNIRITVIDKYETAMQQFLETNNSLRDLKTEKMLITLGQVHGRAYGPCFSFLVEPLGALSGYLLFSVFH